MIKKLIKFDFALKTPLHIGTGSGEEIADSVARRNSRGELIIPASSVAGALRDKAARLAPFLEGGTAKICQRLTEVVGKKDREEECGCLTCNLFGDIGNSNKTKASKLWIYDAVAQNHSAVIRDNVAIDRKTGTAADGAKFDMEAVPGDTEFSVRFELHDVTEQEENLFKLILLEWQEGRIYLGAKKASGFGASTIKNNIQYREYKKELLLDLLQSDDWWEKESEGKYFADYDLNIRDSLVAKDRENPFLLHNYLSIELIMQFSGAVLINSPANAALFGADSVMLTSRYGDLNKPIIPGSSLRGVMRSQAEKILRTIATHKYKASFYEKCFACSPTVAKAMAKQEKTSNDVPLESCSSLWKRYCNNINLKPENDKHCLACEMFGSNLVGTRLYAEDAVFCGDRPYYKLFDFLAIDRFTGGGLEKAKFDALALWQPAFKSKIYIENPQKWEVALLLYVLRDIEEGLVHIGTDGSKGFGQLSFTEITLQYGSIPSDKKDEQKIDIINAQKSSSGIYQVETLNGGLSVMIAALSAVAGDLTRKIEKFKRHHDWQYTKDTYIDNLEKLYPLSGGAQ